MRLNFSGVGEDDIREGVRRIGKVIARAGRALRDADRRRAGAAAPAAAEPPSRPSPTCVPLRRRAQADEGRRPQGRPLAGAQRLAALGRPGRGRARAARPRGACRSTSAPTSSSGSTAERPTSPSSRCTAAAARTAPCRSCSSSSASPTPASRRRRPASAAWTRSSPSTRCATPGIPTPDFYAFNADRVPRARRRRGAAGDRGAARLPDRGQAGRPGLGARDQVRRAPPPTSPARWSPPSPTTPRSCSSATSPGRDLAVSVIDGPGRPEALPVVEAIPREEDFYDFEARYEIGRTRFVCPAELGGGRRARGAGARARRPTGCSAATASPAST